VRSVRKFGRQSEQLLMVSCYQGESRMLDSPDGVCAGQAGVRISSYFRTL